MSRHVLSVHHRDVLPLLGLAIVFPWLWLAGSGVRELCANAVLTVTGYLRRRPDPALERRLRAAFAEFDRDLAEILGDRTPRIRLTADQAPRNAKMPGTFRPLGIGEYPTSRHRPGLAIPR